VKKIVGKKRKGIMSREVKNLTSNKRLNAGIIETSERRKKLID
jgi:hypothetical protein